MKKRLRRKKRVDEVQEFAFEIRFGMDPDLTMDQRNALLDEFVTQPIEANGLQFGGGDDNTWEGVVALDKPRGPATEEHRRAVRNWLERNPNISNVRIGEQRDAQYGWGGQGPFRSASSDESSSDEPSS